MGIIQRLKMTNCSTLITLAFYVSKRNANNGGHLSVALNGLQDMWPPRSDYSKASTLIHFMHKFDSIYAEKKNLV